MQMVKRIWGNCHRWRRLVMWYAVVAVTADNNANFSLKADSISRCITGTLPDNVGWWWSGSYFLRYFALKCDLSFCYCAPITKTARPHYYYYYSWWLRNEGCVVLTWNCNGMEIVSLEIPVIFQLLCIRLGASLC